jgi:hypothetical protein
VISTDAFIDLVKLLLKQRKIAEARALVDRYAARVTFEIEQARAAGPEGER